jgi:hypothetical protein
VKGYVEHYNNVGLNRVIGCITPKNMLAGGRRRSTPSGIGSWKPHGDTGRFVGSRPREKAKTLVSGQFRGTDEVDYFGMADQTRVSPANTFDGHYFRAS